MKNAWLLQACILSIKSKKNYESSFAQPALIAQATVALIYSLIGIGTLCIKSV